VAIGRCNSSEILVILSTSCAFDFGDLTTGGTYPGGTSNKVNDRGVFAGMGTSTTMEYITITSLGNSTAFGDLTVGRDRFDGVSNS